MPTSNEESQPEQRLDGALDVVLADDGPGKAQPVERLDGEGVVVFDRPLGVIVGIIGDQRRHGHVPLFILHRAVKRALEFRVFHDVDPDALPAHRMEYIRHVYRMAVIGMEYRTERTPFSQ